MNTDKTYAEKIASEYAPKETRKVVALKKLDAKAKMPANVFSYTFGIIMALVLGVGMCLTLKVIGDGSQLWFILGIVIVFNPFKTMIVLMRVMGIGLLVSGISDLCASVFMKRQFKKYDEKED